MTTALYPASSFGLLVGFVNGMRLEPALPKINEHQRRGWIMQVASGEVKLNTVPVGAEAAPCSPVSGDFEGTLLVPRTSNPLVIEGLWGIAFGSNGASGSATELYFTAGANDENDGGAGANALAPHSFLRELA